MFSGAMRLSFLNKTYFKLNNSYHGLAHFLVNEEKLSFPTTIFLDKNLQIIDKIKGVALKEDVIK